MIGKSSKTVVSLCLIAALAAAALLAIAASTPASAQPPARPNIILVLTDDLDLKLGTISTMPYLKSLMIDQGTTFSQATVSLSLCCPSRGTILRGQYAHNHEVFTNTPPEGGFEKFHALGLENETVETALQSAGYRTVLLGKYLNGYPGQLGQGYVPPGWSEWYSPVGGTPYNNFNYILNENGTPVPYGSAPQDYLTDVISRKADDFIRRTAPTGQPFFIYLATYAPHSPYTPAPRHENLFPDAHAPRTPSFNEADVSDKPAHIRNLPLLTSAQIATIDESYRKRLQAMQAVDEMLASLIQTLAQTGELANTYIVFTSDNGYHMGQHRLQPGKYWPYEPDVRVPFIVRGPGVPAGQARTLPAGNVDLAPTFEQWGGAAPPSYPFDGRSLAPLFNSPATNWRQNALLEQYPFRPSANSTGVLEPPDPSDAQLDLTPEYVGVRTSTFKFVEYPTGEREFYDLVNDPDELNNLAGGLSQAYLNQLSNFSHAFNGCVGAGCRYYDSVALPPPPR
jgi:arylsulfatase A-like enzyme